jgi:hypothetical protein
MDEAIERKILSLLDQHRIMTIATLRSDGWPREPMLPSGVADRKAVFQFGLR